MAESIYLCSLPGSRALPMSDLRKAFKKGLARLSTHKTSADAFDHASRETPYDGLLVVTGSLALVGQLIKPWINTKKSTVLEADYA